MTDFLRRWNSTERKQAVLEELAEQGVPLATLQQAVANGSELDVFDLVAHVAFDQKPLTRRERANNVKKRDVFGKYGNQARAVLEALLDKFADHLAAVFGHGARALRQLVGLAGIIGILLYR